VPAARQGASRSEYVGEKAQSALRCAYLVSADRLGLYDFYRGKGKIVAKRDRFLS
jgi:hypothetical protein